MDGDVKVKGYIKEPMLCVNFMRIIFVYFTIGILSSLP